VIDKIDARKDTQNIWLRQAQLQKRPRSSNQADRDFSLPSRTFPYHLIFKIKVELALD
jgi:hypothetical protein